MSAITTIQRNGQHLLYLINDILDLSKIDAGKLEVERVPMSPLQIVADVQLLMQVRASAKDLTLGVEFATSVPESIQSDPTRLRQILINLIGNGIKFTEKGGVRVVVRLLHPDRDAEAAPTQPTLQFDVIDTGVGVTDEQAASLFKPFAQADASTSRKFGGTGLGLLISKRLAVLLGGDVTLERTPEDGSTFRLQVATGPLDGVKMIDRPKEAIAPADGDSEVPEPPCGMEYRILLAEDGPDNQRLITSVLKRAGADATVVEDGREAIEAALAAQEEGRPFDVILMDMQMPVMDGYAATSLLRSKGYTHPIVALTAHAMTNDREKCLSVGCDDYATKPIDRHELVRKVAEWARRSDGHRADARLLEKS